MKHGPSEVAQFGTRTERPGSLRRSAAPVGRVASSAAAAAQATSVSIAVFGPWRMQSQELRELWKSRREGGLWRSKGTAKKGVFFSWRWRIQLDELTFPEDFQHLLHSRRSLNQNPTSCSSEGSEWLLHLLSSSRWGERKLSWNQMRSPVFWVRKTSLQIKINNPELGVTKSRSQFFY